MASSVFSMTVGESEKTAVGANMEVIVFPARRVRPLDIMRTLAAPPRPKTRKRTHPDFAKAKLHMTWKKRKGQHKIEGTNQVN